MTTLLGQANYIPRFCLAAILVLPAASATAQGPAPQAGITATEADLKVVPYAPPPKVTPYAGKRALGQAQQAPVFRTRTELIEIDVVVIDKDGNRVQGLTKDDFVLKDRGKVQEVETFSEQKRLSERSVESPRLPVSTRVDVASNTSARAGRLVVLVLDDLHVFKARNDTVREIARKLVHELGVDSSMALLETGGDHSVEVTEDRSRLLDAIDQFKGRQSVRRPTPGCDHETGSPHPDLDNPTPENMRPGCDIQLVNANFRLWETLENAAQILGGDDPRRKAFILVSENVSKELGGLFGGGSQTPEMPDSSNYMAGNLEAGPKKTAHSDYALIDMMNAMRRGNVATYAIDPRGEINAEDLMLECHPAFGFGDDPCEGGGQDQYNWVRVAQRGLTLMAEETGGFAVVNTNDFTSGIDDIIEDIDNYYLLGFYPDDAKENDYRRVQVEVAGRPDLTLRYRRGYELRSEPKPPKDKDPLNLLIGSSLPTNDLPLRLQAIPMPYAKKEARVAVALELTVPTALLREADSDQLLDDIKYGLYAFDLKGAKVRDQQRSGARVVLRPRAGLTTIPDQLTYEIMTEIDLPPGRYQLRAAATSEKLNAGGSVYLSFDVPDFSSDELTVSDLVIGYGDGPHVPIARHVPTARRVPNSRAPLPPLQTAPLLPFDPTLDRMFTPSDTLRVYFKVTQRTAVGLIATISALTPEGATVVSFDRPMPEGTSPFLDIRLPLAQLPAGPYRLQVAVTDGTTHASREVGIVIR